MFAHSRPGKVEANREYIQSDSPGAEPRAKSDTNDCLVERCKRSFILRLRFVYWSPLRAFIGSRPSDHYFRSVCWLVCLFVQSFSQPSLIRFRSKLGICYMSGSRCVP